MSLLRPPVPETGYATPRDSLIALHRPFIALPSVPPTAMAIRDERIPNFQGSGYGIVPEIPVLSSELLNVYTFLQDARWSNIRMKLPTAASNPTFHPGFSLHLVREDEGPYEGVRTSNGPTTNTTSAPIHLCLPGGHLDTNTASRCCTQYAVSNKQKRTLSFPISNLEIVFLNLGEARAPVALINI
ncbi:hypothetical protein NMY22_g19779 [Coprinellus aureogranulatus]|nr:hypothetical protein NMY22_g19779 [Coprinellus aureogranulatus]